ncbi:unnamed protein product [Cylicocyclus nassatus]|uniref:Uncharacterized protein n=1 Tax=Cylicocyclus nassatus TaxID=53992 RepID=A0AA36GSI0_CYLNA|nr:unnamed protein product [Cylicocyclus nassatus]
MNFRILLTSILVLVKGTVAQEGTPDDFIEPNEDDFNREYVDMISLTPFDPSPEPAKQEECRRLKSVKILPAGLMEDLLCQHIIRFFYWQMEQLRHASEKVRNVYLKLHEWSVKHGPLDKMRVTQRNRMTATFNDAEKQDLANLVALISSYVDSDPVLKAHRKRCKTFHYSYGELK